MKRLLLLLAVTRAPQEVTMFEEVSLSEVTLSGATCRRSGHSWAPP